MTTTRAKQVQPSKIRSTKASAAAIRRTLCITPQELKIAGEVVALKNGRRATGKAGKSVKSKG